MGEYASKMHKTKQSGRPCKHCWNVLVTGNNLPYSRTKHSKLHAAIHIAIKLSSGVLFNTTRSIGLPGQNKENVKSNESHRCYERLSSCKYL